MIKIESINGILRFAVVMLMVIIQFAIVIIMSIFLINYSVYIYYLVEMMSLVVILNLVNDRRSPTYKIAWIIIVLLLPVTGYIFYFLWGRTDLNKKINTKIMDSINYGRSFVKQDKETALEVNKDYPSWNKLSTYLQNEGYPVYKNTTTRYYKVGEEFFDDVIKDLEKAEKFIFVEYFIVGEGKLWDRIHEVLKRKASEGVEVKFMMDDFGSMFRIHNNFKKDLRTEGIEVISFNTIQQGISKLYANHRNHQKIIIIDGNIGYTGGANLADEYVNIIQRFGHWKDSGIRLEGEGVWSFTSVFLEMWHATLNTRASDYLKYIPTVEVDGDGYCQPIADGPPNNPRNPAENTYKQIVSGARKYLYIMTPYLVLEMDMEELLRITAESNVDVRIIVPGIPDKKIVNLVTKYNYGKLLASGIKIYEYIPGFIHSKSIICEEVGVIGTINMDFRSFNLQYECGVLVFGGNALNKAKDDFIETLNECREITYMEWKQRPIWHKMVQPILAMFGTLM